MISGQIQARLTRRLLVKLSEGKKRIHHKQVSRLMVRLVCIILMPGMPHPLHQPQSIDSHQKSAVDDDFVSEVRQAVGNFVDTNRNTEQHNTLYLVEDLLTNHHL